MAKLELDPFLIAHRVGDGSFDMAGKYSPAAVRDQMNRAVAIVERGFRTGVLTEQHRLLIHGSGAAAVSAAMQAVKLGVGQVTLSQRGQVFFARQRGSSRILDPVEYDWPAERWEGGTVASGRVPLPYQRGKAKAIVLKQWDPAWRAFLAAYEGKVLRILQNATKGDLKGFDRSLDCTGPGEEETQAGDYRWYPFWEDDVLEMENLGFLRGRPRVLISGGADGALQDFLRVLFPGKTPRDIYKALELSPSKRLELEWRIFNAEDRAKRAWVWSADKAIDCGILSQLQEEHRSAALQLLTVVKAKLAAMLATGAGTDPHKLWLAHSCQHFGACYAFNRFLVLLVDEFFKDTAVGSRLLPGRKLTRVSAQNLNHKCVAGSIEDCLAHPHQAEFAPRFCKRSLLDGAGPLATGESFDRIVVRHGLSGAAKRLSRQSLPYELPAMP